MQDLKYIVVEDDVGTEHMVTFPNFINHDDMLESLLHVRVGTDRDWKRPFKHSNLVSAGFIRGEACYGRSESLDISSRPFADTELFKKQRNI